MSNALLLNRAPQRLRDMFLADDVAEALRTVFPGYDLITHLSAECAILNSKARVTTAVAEQTTVAAFRPWRGS